MNDPAGFQGAQFQSGPHDRGSVASFPGDDPLRTDGGWPGNVFVDPPDFSLAKGTWVLPGFATVPDGDGLLFSSPLALPNFRRGCYFAPFQKHAINPSLNLWPEAYNQCQPLAIRALSELERKGLFLLLETPDGDFLAVLPLTGDRSMAWFNPLDGELHLESGHYGSSAWAGDLPLLCWARGATPYDACRDVWHLAAAHSPAVVRRGRKTFPEMFEYLGWCSWEEFKWDISEAGLQEILDHIESSEVPVRWTLFDDGYIDEGDGPADREPEGQEGEVPAHQNERKLDRFSPRKDRFPHGWERLLQRKGAGREIRWMGVWLNFNGYWGGIRADNHLGPANAHLQGLSPGVKMPKPEAAAARAFYREFVGEQARGGFDFLKVDNQAGNIPFYRGLVPNAVEAAMNNHRALHEAAGERSLPVINCMAHNPPGVFGNGASHVTRCSEDYKKGDLWRAKHHLSNSFTNMLWLGQTVWGDHDMFHSSDDAAGDVMARSKAISGGPIYLSDHPLDFHRERIAPLCFRDGRILRPLAPAVPLPDSIFVDTYDEAAALRVIAPLPHHCAAIAVYNLTAPGQPVRASIDARDYAFAGAMLQDADQAWRVPAEGLVAFDVKTGKSAKLAPGQPIALSLPAFGDEFFVLCPIVDGVAVIGRPDKYLPPGGITEIRRDDLSIGCSLHEPAEILFWSESARLEADGAPLDQTGPHTWSYRAKACQFEVTVAR